MKPLTDLIPKNMRLRANGQRSIPRYVRATGYQETNLTTLEKDGTTYTVRMANTAM